ncbi:MULTISPECIES: DUF881 domain-containing protein [Streptacidiphilus]|uniref:DUF881 domain-containing protein n=1 Tax=Streptacidiphilus cavernicola TaxID=3342716 RepID=A0ABV6UZ49_9ACTN|nr:DUF881 domain-containing protein [Streptacidiphilus jeojiense]
MSLLTNVMEHALDDGYADAARSRGQYGTSRMPGTLRGKLFLGGGLLLAALVLTVGAVQVRASAPVAAQERQELIARVGTAQANADQVQQEIDKDRAQLKRLQQQAKADGAGDGGSTAQLQQLQLVTGVGAAYGPGIRLVLDDAVSAGTDGGDNPRTAAGFSDTGRVRDRDVQLVVNALWQSGAEGVAINGQRLTALSAIRAAGDAILVDNHPLVLPYTVDAIGGSGMESGFQQNVDGGVYLEQLKADYAIRYSISSEDRVDLPAAARSGLQYATPSGRGGATP